MAGPGPICLRCYDDKWRLSERHWCDACEAAPHGDRAHDCEHTSMQHGADGCNVAGCLCAFMSWDES